MKRAVITGATGAIGMALIQVLLRQQMEVTVIIRPDSKRIQRIPLHKHVRIVECPMRDMLAITKEQAGSADIFFHLAWAGTIGPERNDPYLQIENVRYTVDAVQLADRLGCKVFLGAGSQAEYGRVEEKLTGEIPTNPENEYGIAKLCASQLSRFECKKRNIKHIWTRILSVYGPYDGENTMIISGIHKMLQGERASFSKGEQQWDYLYSEDAATALYLAAVRGKDGKVYPVGSAKTQPIFQYIEEMKDAVNKNLEVGIGDLPYREQQVMYLCADISELTGDTGFLPTVSFKEGIRKTVAWCKENK